MHDSKKIGNWVSGSPMGTKLVTPWAEWELVPAAPHGTAQRGKALPTNPSRTMHEAPSADFLPDGTPISDEGRRLVAALSGALL